MPAVLNLKPQEIDTAEKRSNYTVSIIGCGQTGILFANAFAQAGFKVVCSDADQSLLKKIAKGKAPFFDPEVEATLKSQIKKGQINTIGEPKKAVAQSDIIVIAVTAKADDKKKPDYSEVANACKQVGTALHGGVLIVYGGIAGLGFIEGTVKEALENTSGLKVGKDFGLAYIPIYCSDAKPVKSIIDSELHVAATDKTSLHAAVNLAQSITKNIRQVEDVKTTEIATLFKIARRDAAMALANELAIFCESANRDYFEIQRLLAGEESFCPMITKEENRNEAYLLLDSAENLNAKLKIPVLARQINEDMVKHAVNLTQDVLRSCGKTLRRARVAVLGTAHPRTATATFIKMIETKGAKANLYDPMSKKELSESHIMKGSLNEAVEGTDCIVILSVKEQFKRLNFKKLKSIMKSPSVIVDLTGIFEPEKIEAEGFIYRGLGRGTENQ